jgi:hypothetical protein
MGILGDIASAISDAFSAGPSNWKERLGEEIVFTSPSGVEFKAKWRGDSRSMKKKLGIIQCPRIAGDIAQDLGATSWVYPIPIYFDGDNNDLDARAFTQACGETGLWDVIHPVFGPLPSLQLVSVAYNDEPVESGNLTKIDTEWIEPIDPLTLKTGRELAGLIDAKVTDLNVSAAQQFANNILTESERLKATIENTTRGIERVSDLILGPLFTTVDALDTAVNAIQRGTTDTFNATVFRAEELAGQIENLLELPLFGSDDLGMRVAAYTDLATAMLDMLPGEGERVTPNSAGDDEKLNSIATLELGLTCCVAAIGRSVSDTKASSIITADGTIKTRAQALQAITDIVTLHDQIVDAVEAAYDDYSDALIDEQRSAFTESYADLAALLGLVIERLLVMTSKLAVERRITLASPRAPIEIAITEYGQLGANDEYLDLFIASNDLQGDDILLLPAGREVVIYG